MNVTNCQLKQVLEQMLAEMPPSGGGNTTTVVAGDGISVDENPTGTFTVANTMVPVIYEGVNDNAGTNFVVFVDTVNERVNLMGGLITIGVLPSNDLYFAVFRGDISQFPIMVNMDDVDGLTWLTPAYEGGTPYPALLLYYMSSAGGGVLLGVRVFQAIPPGLYYLSSTGIVGWN